MKKKMLILGAFIAGIAGTGALHAETLPQNVFKKYPISENSSAKVHALVKEAANYVHPEPRKARKLYVQVYKLLATGSKIDKYDYLWTQYGLLKSSHETGTSNFGPGTREDFIKIARNMLAYLDTQNVGDWMHTELGAFQAEAFRQASNALAWEIAHDAKAGKVQFEEALVLVNKSESHMRGAEDYYILDTKVRILLKLERKNEAYKIVKMVLKEDADFGDFQDLKNTQDYKTWSEKNKG